ncbi:MAG TPA: hypothetical protein VFN88_05110 [Caulobacteraceae bacterium]|jgi:hypothetical protein|nr:hypothetical protein [Caulobacteraceae bacterium]
MTASALTLVTGSSSETQSEPISARVRRLQAEARAMAFEHIDELGRAMANVHRLSLEIAAGGDAYPVGIREMARRMAEETELRTQAMEAILARGSH